MGHSPPGFARQFLWPSSAWPERAKSDEEAIASAAIVDLRSFMVSAFEPMLQIKGKVSRKGLPLIAEIGRYRADLILGHASSN